MTRWQGQPGITSEPWIAPLLLCSSKVASKNEPHDLDRIRMQKAVFLLTQLGPPSWRAAYSYEPYNWGPYSRALTEDLRQLQDQNLLRLSFTGGSRPSYGRYVLTEAGEASADDRWGILSREERKFLRDVRHFVTHQDFNSLLRSVYRAFPTFASKSRWSGRS